ncbi:MAG: biopolymer transporter ExbD [Deltaproteobacteria bacterium]|nr:biopolymer transporter ExbD [Deltaproteobacteria bacterium]
MSDRFAMFGPKKHRIFGTGHEGGGDEFGVDLNLTPLMDVMSNILFFLLAGFGAAIISFLAASVPVQSESTEPPEPPRSDKVTVNLQITPTAYKINIAGEKLTPEDAAKYKKELPKVADGRYDSPALTQLLFQIKQVFPASDTLMIVPSDTTVYAEIVDAMEAAKDIPYEGKRMRLFPKAVVADLVRGEPEGEGGP